MGAMVEAARGTGLAVHSIRDIGPDYAITLRAWMEAWEKHRQEVRQIDKEGGSKKRRGTGCRVKE